MILLDHIAPAHTEVGSLFYQWEFWVAAFTVISGMVGSYVKQMLTINSMKINLVNLDDKYNARINNLKEQNATDRKSQKENFNKLFDLFEKINERLSRIEGAVTKR